jgi:hypothetical protein
MRSLALRRLLGEEQAPIAPITRRAPAVLNGVPNPLLESTVAACFDLLHQAAAAMGERDLGGRRCPHPVSQRWGAASVDDRNRAHA